MRVILKPKPVSIWLSPIEFGVIAVIVGITAIMFSLVKVHNRLRRIERAVHPLKIGG